MLLHVETAAGNGSSQDLRGKKVQIRIVVQGHPDRQGRHFRYGSGSISLTDNDTQRMIQSKKMRKHTEVDRCGPNALYSIYLLLYTIRFYFYPPKKPHCVINLTIKLTLLDTIPFTVRFCANMMDGLLGSRNGAADSN